MPVTNPPTGGPTTIDVYYGGKGGISTTAVGLDFLTPYGDTIGLTLGGAGDVNGDGADLTTTAYAYTPGTMSPNNHLVAFGGKSRDPSSMPAPVVFAGSSCYLGVKFGDANGDGFDDMNIAALSPDLQGVAAACPGFAVTAADGGYAAFCKTFLYFFVEPYDGFA